MEHLHPGGTQSIHYYAEELLQGFLHKGCFQSVFHCFWIEENIFGAQSSTEQALNTEGMFAPSIFVH